MNIADYIKELLAQQGELSVPGLGYFVQMRKSAYYDEAERTFYPPHHEVQFDPQSIDDDDALANYITERKNISLASSKYFLDKYVSGLKEQALLQDMPFADIGFIGMDASNVLFTPNNNLSANDPAFYGYVPLQLKDGGIVAPAKPEPAPRVPIPVPVAGAVAEQVSYSKSVLHPHPDADHGIPHVLNLKADNAEEEAVMEETYEERRSMKPWYIFGGVILVIIIGALIATRYRPDLYQRLLFPTHKADSVNKLPTQTITHEAITMPGTEDLKRNKNAPKTAADSATAKEIIAAAKTSMSIKDSIPKGSWIIVGGVFTTKPKADDAVENFKGFGIDGARFIAPTKPGEPYKVIVGAFDSHAKAESARLDMLVLGKLSEVKLNIEQYK